LTPTQWICDLFLGILILIDARGLSSRQSVIVGIAILSPWALVLVPSVSFANFAVIGLPLIWAVVLLTLMLPDIYAGKTEKGLTT
jgi:hypothetical protein